MSERTSIWIDQVGPGEWPHRLVGYVIYNSDYSGLDEPYLSAVKEAEEKRKQATSR